eukprot:TRINITY_DN7565_c0_g1_i1.p1 TRINITY_DN7565_c0_g1~~TRINITY_DN7565_c0_g1_i1.p1  ORF type:complete len:167 (+),score=32.19 TRINITY_DN7565_c0_g1_i1:35-502(+)
MAEDSRKVFHKFKKLFDDVDRNNNGTLNYTEFKKFWYSIDEDRVRPPTPIRKIKFYFKAADINQDDSVSFDELETCLFQTYPEDPAEKELYIKALFRAIDTNNDGKLSKREVRSAFRHLMGKVRVKELDEAFNELDVDSDGEVTLDEFRDTWFGS